MLTAPKAITLHTETLPMADVPRPNPELMIIGDSLAQGCRSLTVNQTFCAQSWAARLAQQQGWRFVTPDLPRPILFELEEEVRRLDTLTLSVENFEFEGILDRLRDNLEAWLMNARESAFDCFDNLGLAGALIYDLYTRSAASSAVEVADLTPQGAATPLALDQVGDVHLAINGRFTLNPSQDPAFNDLTPLEWVRARRPRRLLVQVGHNHGLYQIGSQAEDVSFTQPGGNGVHGDYWSQLQTLATALAGLPGDVGAIVVALLPKVGAVANLEPREASRENGYAPTYGPVLSLSTAILSGTRLAAIDAAINDANARIRQIVGDAAQAAGTAGRLNFLDTYALFDRLDFKNSLDPQRQVAVDAGLSLDNRYVAGRFHVWPLNAAGWRLSAGGLQSADGMHPSGGGYTMLATETMNLLGLGGDPQALLQRAFSEDALLSHYPIELRAVTSLLQMARDLSRTNAFFPSGQTFLTEGVHAGDILRAMHSVFLP
jgi:hypothetical protein